MPSVMESVKNEIKSLEKVRKELDDVKYISRLILSGGASYKYMYDLLQQIVFDNLEEAVQSFLLANVWKASLMLFQRNVLHDSVKWLTVTIEFASRLGNSTVKYQALQMLIEAHMKLRNLVMAQTLADQLRREDDERKGLLYLIQIAVHLGSPSIEAMKALITLPAGSFSFDDVISALKMTLKVCQKQDLDTLLLELMSRITCCYLIAEAKAELYSILVMVALDQNCKPIVHKILGEYVNWYRSLDFFEKRQTSHAHERLIDHTEDEIKWILSSHEGTSSKEAFEYASQLAAVLILLEDHFSTESRCNLSRFLSYQVYCIRVCHGLEKARTHLASFVQRKRLEVNESATLKKLVLDVEIDNFEDSCDTSWQRIERVAQIENTTLENFMRQIQFCVEQNCETMDEEEAVMKNEVFIRMVVRRWIETEKGNRPQLENLLKTLAQKAHHETPFNSWISQLLWNVGLKSSDVSFLGMASEMSLSNEEKLAARLAQIGKLMVNGEEISFNVVMDTLQELMTSLHHINDENAFRLISLYRMKLLLMIKADPSNAVLECIGSGDLLTMELLTSLLSHPSYTEPRVHLLRMGLVKLLKDTTLDSRKIRGLRLVLMLVKSFLEAKKYYAIIDLFPDLLTIAQMPDEADEMTSAKLLVLLLTDVRNASQRLFVTDAFMTEARGLRDLCPSLVSFLPGPCQSVFTGKTFRTIKFKEA